MTAYNTDLMIEVREAILAEPERHDQKRWADSSGDCGTTYCIAGWATFLSGQPMLFEGNGLAGYTGSLTGNTSIEMYARQALGLGAEEAQDLFFCMDNELALAKLDELIEKGKNQS